MARLAILGSTGSIGRNTLQVVREMRDEIEDKLGIIATDNYGLSEVMGPGVAGECIEKSGLHLNEDRRQPQHLRDRTTRVLARRLPIACSARARRDSVPPDRVL